MTRSQPIPMLAESLRFMLLVLLSFSTLNSQTGAQTATELVRFLSDPARSEGRDGFIFGCGISEEHRKTFAAAKSLVNLGRSATPEIEKNLDLIGKRAPEDEAVNTDLLLAAYAHIEGSAAYPRLHQMMENPKLAALGSALDGSVGIAFSLTSYVSFRPWTRVPASPGGYCGSPEPRHALNNLILAWEGNSRSLFESSLGPRAGAAFALLLNGKTWAQLREGLWPASDRRAVAVGYRLRVDGVWSLPTGSVLDSAPVSQDLLRARSVEIDVEFRNSIGIGCGTHKITFVAVGTDSWLPVTYAMDNPDLEDLLRVIGSCASQ